jgi:hypothetical protein
MTSYVSHALGGVPMEVWVVSGLIVGGALAIFLVLRALEPLERRGRLQRRDEKRHAEQLEWQRRLQAGQGIPTRYETTYWPDEMVDEDAARMAELGYYVADEVLYEDGSRRLVYRLEGVSAL